MESTNASVKTKTWSRELAAVLMIGVAVLAYSGDKEMVEVVIWPAFTFALAAFGFKQDSVKTLMGSKAR